MDNWKEITLGDYITTNDKNIGRSYPFENILYLDTGSITKNRIDGFQQYLLSEAPSRAKRLVQQNDIIYSSVRPNQLHYGYIEDHPENLVVSTGFVVIRANEDFLNSKFLYYYLTDNNQTEYLHQIAEASTSAYPSLKPSDIEALEFSIPPLPEQKAIAEVLSSLDDKIDLLHRQNKTLEAMAETLFRQWFEEKDFDSTTADLVDIQNGYAFKSKDFSEVGLNKVIKIKNISGSTVDISNADRISESVADNVNAKFSIVGGDILFAMTGAEIGKMGIVERNSQNLWLNQRVGLFKEKYEGSKYLAYLCLKSDFGQDYIENTATGSAQPNISGTGIEKCPFPKLTTEQIEHYSQILIPQFDKIVSNLGNIKTLTKLRDTLLPKLMSGEVRIKMKND